MAQTVFVTGAGGFVGRRLLDAASGRSPRRFRCLLRSRSGLPAELGGREDVEVVVGDLLRPQSYAGALAGCDRVVHLAARTGKARRSRFFRVNTEGTRRLLEAAREAEVGGFLHVSTIAVKYRDQRRCHYARSKAAAEDVVREGGVPYAILRPTIVTGRDAPVLAGLSRLAGMPVMPVFGRGDVEVQPISVDDVTSAIFDLLDDEPPAGLEIDLGGPDVVTMEGLMLRIRERLGRSPRTLHLPLRAIRVVLGLLEPVMLPVLPITAGQLAAFANDGTAEPCRFVRERRDGMQGLGEALDGAFADV